MTCPDYPAVTLQQATDLVIPAANDLHSVINGLATGEVTLCDGDTIPTLRKALVDNFYFLPAIPYVVSTTNEVYNQLYTFDDYIIYSPAATASNPITLVADPLSSNEWRLFSGTGQTIEQSPRQTGDGVTTSFSSPTGTQDLPENFIVTIDGVKQAPTIDYTINASGNVDFSTAPELNTDIDIIYFKATILANPLIGDGIVAIPLISPRYIGDSVTVTYSTEATNQVEAVLFDVFLDGEKARPDTDYSVELNGDITFVVAPATSVAIDITFNKDQALDSYSTTLQQAANNLGVNTNEVALLQNGASIDSLKAVVYLTGDTYSTWLTNGQTGILDGTLTEATGEAGLDGGGSVTLVRNEVLFGRGKQKLVFNTVEDMINGILNDGTVLSDEEFGILANNESIVETKWHNTTSKIGGAEYQIITKTQADSDGIDYSLSGVFLGYAYLLDDGVTVAVLNIKEGTIYTSQIGIINNVLGAEVPINLSIEYLHSLGGGVLCLSTIIHLLDVRDYYDYNGLLVGIESIRCKDSVDIIGVHRDKSVLRVKDFAYGDGAFYGLLRSESVVGYRLSNCTLHNFTVDGVNQNQVEYTGMNPAQANNIYLPSSNNVIVKSIKSINANGQNIMVVGTPSDLADNISITDCTVINSKNIGIQCTLFAGLVISNCYITDTEDNCIDVNGEDGSAVALGNDYIIEGNTCNNGLVGIFSETTRKGNIYGNIVSGCDFGATVNRINGEPRDILISTNTFVGNGVCVRVSGDTGGLVTITENLMRDFSTSGIEFGAGSGNCSGVNAHNNTMTPLSNIVPLIRIGTSGDVSFCNVTDNYSTLVDLDYYYENLLGATLTSVNIDVPTNIRNQNKSKNIAGISTNVPSGGSTSLTVPSNTMGNLIIRGDSGGTWESVWVGSFVSTNTIVKSQQISTDFIAPGNSISSVTTSGSDLDITINATATGSFCNFKWFYEYY